MKFFQTYTSLAEDPELLDSMEQQGRSLSQFMLGIAEPEIETIHPPYSWTVRQVYAHIVDTERVFGFRAMHCLRSDDSPLPSFDHSECATAELNAQRSIDVLARDFMLQRESHVLLLRSASADAWSQTCQASGIVWTLDDIARSMLGHVRYHQAIIEQRLSNTPE